MADFSIEIAGHVAAVSSLFDSTKDYCRDFLTDQAPEFRIHITREDLQREQRLWDEEAVEEGFRFRTFSDPFLERAAIQRKLADQLFQSSVLMLHGSAIAVDGRGYLFTAKSGTGKSTHTRLWREVLTDRAQMVNDDKPFITLDNAQILLCGSPWSGKHGLHSNISVPLAGICILERGSKNCIVPIQAEDALPMLLHQGYDPTNGDPHSPYAALISHLAEKTPLWRMACNKEPEAAMIAFHAMSNG